MPDRKRTLRAVATLLVAICGPCPVAAVDCEAPAQAAMILRQAEVLLLGELHGTQEAPRLVGTLACVALEAGRAVTVGLELPRSLQADVDTYLASEGSPTAKRALLGGSFWQRDYQDGRTSAAIFELIETIRLLAEGEEEVRLVLFDVDRPGGPRDRSMAMHLRSAAPSADGLMLVLTGSLHARLGQGRLPGSEPMAFHLAGMLRGATLLSFNLTHSGGTAWVCTGGSAASCGVLQVRGREGLEGPELFPERPGADYSGRWHLGTVTASPPAGGTRR